jgi:hypothetical protein
MTLPYHREFAGGSFLIFLLKTENRKRVFKAGGALFSAACPDFLPISKRFS